MKALVCVAAIWRCRDAASLKGAWSQDLQEAEPLALEGVLEMRLRFLLAGMDETLEGGEKRRLRVRVDLGVYSKSEMGESGV